MSEALKALNFYIVMNSDGQFFRAKGRGGYGQTWVDDPIKARIYAKIGPARAAITFFANHYPKYPAPSLVKMGVGTIEIVDESDRVAKKIAAEKKRKANFEIQRKQEAVEYAKRALVKAQENLNSLTKGTAYLEKP